MASEVEWSRQNEDDREDEGLSLDLLRGVIDEAITIRLGHGLDCSEQNSRLEPLLMVLNVESLAYGNVAA